MKHKNFGIILLLIFSLLLYVGCGKKSQQEQIEKEKIAIQKVEDAYNSISLPETTTDNLSLLDKYGEVLATWSSSNKDVVNTNGIVNRTYQDIEVTLKVILEYDGQTKSKEFNVVVLKDETLYNNYVVEILENTFNSLDIPSLVTSDLTLSLTYGEVGAVWSSSNEEVLTSSGIANFTHEDQEVVLSVVLSYDGISITKEIQLIISKSDELYAQYLIFNTVVDSVSVSTEPLTENIELPTEINSVSITWVSSNESILSSSGVVNMPKETTTVTLVGNFQLGSFSKSKEYTVTILGTNEFIKSEMNKKIETLSMPKETSTNLDLPKEHEGMTITWKSKTISFMSDEGEIERSEKTRTAKLLATFSYDGVTVDKEYQIKVLAYTDIEMLEHEMNTIEIPNQTNIDLSLPIYFEYDIIGEWKSSDESVVNSDGIVTIGNEEKIVTLTVTLRKDDTTMEKTFKVTVLGKNSGKAHQVISRASSFDQSKFTNVELVDDRMVLVEGATEGKYESNEIETISFVELVASWASTSSVNATAELQVSVKIDGVWSDYITYYPWGFGLQNKCYDQNKTTVKLVEDEVKVLNGKSANALKFIITLRRTDASYESPKFSLASFALNNKSYSYPVDITNLPKEVVHNVPRLYQQEVPSIGNSICSPTTSTMLLKYKGENFSEFDQYEHRYIALKFREYNSMLFGNWVYNTVGMSSFGYNTYVARMYSVEELVEHLANVGPVGLSMKGQMTSDKKDYYTPGHLIVGIGYRYVNGELYIVCNDPNVPEVECMYSYTVFKNTWRNVAYIIE